MKHFVEQVVGPLGQPISGATVTVRVANATPGTGALATIYSIDNTGTTPISGSAVTTDTSGTFDFYAPDGRYDLVAAVTGFNKTVADIEIFDATEKNSGDSTVVLALKPVASDGIIYCSPNGSDFNDGFSWGSAKLTIQAAVNALPTSGGTVHLSAGTFTQNSPVTLKSNVQILGSGTGQADSVTCPTTISTTLASGDLFYYNGFNDGKMADLVIKNTGASGANAAIRLTAAQRNRIERVYISGPFARGIQLDSSSTAAASCIWNSFMDIHTTGLAINGIGLLLDSGNASNKVINGNFFYNFQATGGTSGCGIKLTNSGVHNQVINENVFWASEANAISGTALRVDQGSTRGNVFIDIDAEGSTTGLSKATANTLTFIGGNFSANGVNISDSQPGFTQMLGTNVGGTIQNFAITPAGGIYADGLGLGGSAPLTNTIGGATGWAITASGNTVAIVNVGSLELNSNKALVMDSGSTITSYNGIATVGNGIGATYGQDDKTGQSASIGAVTLLTGTASSGGHYNLCFSLYCTATDASGATVSFTGNWTSDSVARTSTSATIGVNATTQQLFGQVPLNADNSTNITYTTTVTGAPTTGRYAIHVWLQKQ